MAQAHLDRIAEVDGEVHAFLYVDRARALATAAAVDAKIAAGEALGPLAGVPLALKDVLTYAGAPTTCGSKILEHWVPPYSATVTRRLLDADLVILGKTNMDEFAMGSSTENSAFGPTRNPWDLTRIPGGSGGGSSAALAAFEAPLAIGTDTGGSIRQPAAVTGTVGVKPTYGGTSRYGLVALASSLDTPGPCARTVLDAALLHQVIGGHDPCDSTSIDAPVPDVVGAARSGDVSGLRVGVVRELRGEGYAPGVEQRFTEAVDLLDRLGAEIVEVSCPHFRYALAAYYLILPSECSSNLARFDGMRFGLRVGDDGVASAEQVMAATREAGFGAEVKRRIIIGTYALSSGYYDAYYGQAQKVRTLISRDFDQAFQQRGRAGLADHAADRLPDRGEGRRSAGHVLQRPVHDPVQPGRQRQRLVPGRAGAGGRAAGRAAGDGSAAGRRPAVPGRGRPGAGAHRDLGRATAGPDPRGGDGPMTLRQAPERCPTTRPWPRTTRSSGSRCTSS